MLCGCLFLVGESGVQKISVSSHEQSADRKRNMLTVDIGLALELCYNKSDSPLRARHQQSMSPFNDEERMTKSWWRER